MVQDVRTTTAVNTAIQAKPAAVQAPVQEKAAPFPTSNTSSAAQVQQQQAAAQPQRLAQSATTQASVASTIKPSGATTQQSGVTQAPQAPQTAGAGTSLAGAVKGFQGQQGQGDNSNGQGQQQSRQQAQSAVKMAMPAATAPKPVEVYGITQLLPEPPQSPTAERSFAEKTAGFLSDFSLFKSRTPVMDPTEQAGRYFPMQWLNHAQPLVPPLAYAAAADVNDNNSRNQRLKPSTALSAYRKPGDMIKTYAANEVLSRQVSMDWDVQAWGSFPGATHYDPQADRLMIQISQDAFVEEGYYEEAV